jgi:cyclopropane-fatty-acyl-phospholipid synthase
VLERFGAQALVTRLLSSAGVRPGGSSPSDIQVAHPRFYTDVLLRQSLGLGESYMRGDWSVERLDEFFYRLFSSSASAPRALPGLSWAAARATVLNLQSRRRAPQVCLRHYDLDDELFARMLDERRVYTCAYWKDATTLEEAQRNKLELVCDKLGLRPGMRVLDIGCGYGSFMKYAVETRGVECVGYSLSRAQTRWGQESCRGLPIEFVHADYRDITGTFDRIASIGMLEAVGPKNLRAFFQVLHRSLAPDGIALVHTVGSNVSGDRPDPWCDRYIFPNGVIPSIAQIGAALEDLFVMEDWHNFGPDYERTLLEWHRRFQAAWPQLASRFTPEFKRMWEFYLLAFAGGFRARRWQLWQIVLTRQGRKQPPCRLA